MDANNAAGMPAAPPARDDEDDAEVDFPARSHQETLDMTPMVDVVLLLLLFFMVTASYSMQKIFAMNKPADPHITNRSPPLRAEIVRENVIVEIDRHSVISIDGELLHGRESVKNLVSRAAREGYKTKAIVVAHGDSHNAATVKALDGIRAAGIAEINYQVRSDD